jgi:hypothetical protein
MQQAVKECCGKRCVARKGLILLPEHETEGEKAGWTYRLRRRPD